MEEEGNILQPLLRCRPGMSDRMLGKCNRCWRDNKLAIVILLFGLFWCSLAIVMIFLYTDLIEESEEAHATDVPFEPPKAEQQTSCGNYFCAFYGECYIDKVSNGPACRCPLLPCPNGHTPVCGDDGMTYRTQCHLERSSCKEQRRIKNKHPGECKGKEPVHGGWSAWGDWSPCSVSCGAGKRRRFRDCKNPAPSPSGRYCGDSWMQEDNCFIECGKFNIEHPLLNFVRSIFSIRYFSFVAYFEFSVP